VHLEKSKKMIHLTLVRKSRRDAIFITAGKRSAACGKRDYTFDCLKRQDLYGKKSCLFRQRVWGGLFVAGQATGGYENIAFQATCYASFRHHIR
jgi:hypothetical protein